METAATGEVQTMTLNMAQTAFDRTAPRAAMEARDFPDGGTIYAIREPANALYRVHSGRVTLSIIPDGEYEVRGDNERSFQVYGRDDYFGENCLTSRLTPHWGTAKALGATTIQRFPRSAIFEKCDQDPKWSTVLMDLALCLAEERRKVNEICLFRDKILGKLASLLIYFGERWGEEREGGCVFIEPLMHYVLANALGTRREVITGTMNQLRQKGFLFYSQKEIILRPAIQELSRKK